MVSVSDFTTSVAARLLELEDFSTRLLPLAAL